MLFFQSRIGSTISSESSAVLSFVFRVGQLRIRFFNQAEDFIGRWDVIAALPLLTITCAAAFVGSWGISRGG